MHTDFIVLMWEITPDSPRFSVLQATKCLVGGAGNESSSTSASLVSFVINGRTAAEVTAGSLIIGLQPNRVREIEKQIRWHNKNVIGFWLLLRTDLPWYCLCLSDLCCGLLRAEINYISASVVVSSELRSITSLTVTLLAACLGTWVNGGHYDIEGFLGMVTVHRS